MEMEQFVRRNGRQESTFEDAHGDYVMLCEPERALPLDVLAKPACEKNPADGQACCPPSGGRRGAPSRPAGSISIWRTCESGYGSPWASGCMSLNLLAGHLAIKQLL
jgi:hypothetical protein